MSDTAVMAAKAARILEDLGPYLDGMEQDALAVALTCSRATETGQAEAMDKLRFVTVIRELRGRLEHVMNQGAVPTRDPSARYVA